MANTLVVVAVATGLPNSNGTANFSAWANANLSSITERTDNTGTVGVGGGLGIATGGKATAGAYGNTTVTLGNFDEEGDDEHRDQAVAPRNGRVGFSLPRERTGPGRNPRAGRGMPVHALVFGNASPLRARERQGSLLPTPPDPSFMAPQDHSHQF